MILGDVLVDDALHNATAYRADHDALIVTIAYPYNEFILPDPLKDPFVTKVVSGPVHRDPYSFRFDGWENPKRAWMKIYAAIFNEACTRAQAEA
jgi:hypothetical protein